ncbi:MAG TPA: type 1 glutamine amidotransferase domain-containing protein [Polyangia bacterium]|nr:type 1 glutamine amidotransferase domain-containing protein [Polyangia bacterium]
MAKQRTKGGRVACLLAAGFEDSELRVPYDRLRQAGYLVEIIGEVAGERLVGERGRETITADFGIDEVQVRDYEGLLIPGGHSPDTLRADQRFIDFVKDFDRTGRPLAAVCHGPQLLLAAELQRGRTLTAWKTIQGDLRQAGAEVRDQAVVVDGNWITSRQPSDLEAFSSKFIEELGDLEERGGWQPGEAAPPASG